MSGCCSPAATGPGRMRWSGGPAGPATPGALAGYRAALGRLDHRVQVVIRAIPIDTAATAARWDARAAVLPDPLAALARDQAAWIRRELPTLGLLVRRAYLVVPAED